MEVSTFEKNFDVVNKCYRRGWFEAYLIENEKKEWIIEIDVPTAVDQTNLRDKAHLLYQTAREWFETSEIPYSIYDKVFRAMSLSFEIDDNFLFNDPDKKQFFSEVFDDFSLINLVESTPLTVLIEKFEKYSSRISPPLNFYSQETKSDNFLKFGNEIFLIAFTGSMNYYRPHITDDLQLGLEKLKKVLQLLEDFSEEKKLRQREPSRGLYGLAFYILARFQFALGSNHEAETNFRKSFEYYLKRIETPLLSDLPFDPDAKFLHLRRAALVQIIGLAFQYYTESKLDDALKILNFWQPILHLNCGKVLSAYAKLISVEVRRAKFSNNIIELNDCEIIADKCLFELNQAVGETHYPYRAKMELSLIYLYQAAYYEKRIKEEPQKLEYVTKKYEQALKHLDSTINYAKKREEAILRKNSAGTNSPNHRGSTKITNRRLLTEALHCKIYLMRKQVRIKNPDNLTIVFETYQKTLKMAHKALVEAKGMNQMEADLMLARGRIFQDIYFLKFKNNKEESFKYKELAKNDFLAAAEINSGENPRITAQVHLYLTNLFIYGEQNLLPGKYYYDKLEENIEAIQHCFIKDAFADLKRKFEQNLSVFFVDPKKHLKIKEWSKELEDFLIDNVLRQWADETVQKYNELPEKKDKTDLILDTPVKLVKKGKNDKRPTQISILEKGFEQKMNVSRVTAYRFAKENLEKFNKYFDEAKKTLK
jgi:hypothetical protein